MKTYSISAAAELLEVDRRTLHRWISKGLIPAPKMEIAGGQLRKTWTEEDISKLKEHKASGYWGKGINRKTGKKAKRK